VENAKLAGVSLNTFIATMMAAHKLTHPNEAFFVSNLTCPKSVEKVSKYSMLLKEKYGYDGIDALGMFVNEETPMIEDQLLNSEITAGSGSSAANLQVGQTLSRACSGTTNLG
jgi:hypothetical protein